MKVAVVGATGLVGTKILQVLEERQFPVSELIPVASERSIGKELELNGKKYKVISPVDAVKAKPDIAIFSAGRQTSLDWAPAFAKAGTFVIDNSSAWRMTPDIPLVIPEVNAKIIKKEHKIIANPNCSTIQMLMALAPLHKAFKIIRVVVSTYQSITGTGVKALEQLEREERDSGLKEQVRIHPPAPSLGKEGEKAYPYQIYRNCLPHCDDFLDNGYTKEEMKLVNETRKILNDESIQLTATAVRVPVVGGHSESINIEFKRNFELAEVRTLLAEASGVMLMDDPANNIYPMPITAHESDEVFVGRIRRDSSRANTLNIWVVSDNLRKGAATNAVQIAEYLLKKKLVKTIR
ncbi:MAG: aspartate-semialdehyde dehydrogenase [Bacteroidota bacterium]|nr:aspartate-semialdehyde dehydrogenase [Bacteroidota bacterium]